MTSMAAAFDSAMHLLDIAKRLVQALDTHHPHNEDLHADVVKVLEEWNKLVDSNMENL